MKLVLAFVLAFSLQAQTVFVARHAERTGEPDPPLNAEGQRRAQALARALADAKVTAFYTSEMLRTRQTAEPAAKQAGKTVVALNGDDIDGIVRRVRADARPDHAVLVVGHRNTVPLIVKALGGGDIFPLGSLEHDRLIVLTLLPDGKSSIVTLRYGEPSAP